MTLDLQATIVSDLMYANDWLYATPGDQGPGPGPVLRPIVFVSGSKDIPQGLTGSTGVESIQPRYFDDD